MFPFDIDDADIAVEVEEQKPPSDYEIDFSTGKLTGRTITGLDAIKQWVRLVLSTDRYYYGQYAWDHGSELQSLIGKNYDAALVESEVKRMLEDALLVNDDIDDISDLVCEINGDRLTATFTIITPYGKGDISV